MALTNGVMEEFTQDNGKIILCMGKVFIVGLMVEDIKDNTKMIKNMEREYIFGRMVENTMEIG